MAESLAASDLWLSSGKESLSKTTSFEPPCLSFPSEFPYEFDSFGSNSDLNSPVESAVSSTDSTGGSSDDDEFFVGLAQQFAWTSLCETEKSTFPCFNPNKIEKKYVKAGSPQSTLSGIDAWFRPEGPSSQLKSPPMAVFGADNDARVLIHAASREAARLKMYGQTTPYHNNGFVGARSSIPVKSTSNVEYGLFSTQNCARNLAFSAQVQKVGQDLVLQALRASAWERQAKVGWLAQPHRKPDIQSRERNIVNVTSRCVGGTGSLYHSPWIPPHQNQHPPPNASAMRCIQPAGGSAIKRASSGTGVFLPRRHVNPSDCRHKQGSPAINFTEEMKSSIQAPFNAWLSSSFDSRKNPLLPLPRSIRAEGAVKQELHLPQEWTY
ncbi:uncharacterized protein LOC111458886 [Cucurbita moschata]|uniref:Uncharacterized protein LOC111458886 n=1 Tax=Cucurbita moschata TaxID=3662 RepID=A0A6J1H0F4_CUCMO|nr:uncharacterized protein LOC111458886 [Cucurbita moschata]